VHYLDAPQPQTQVPKEAAPSDSTQTTAQQQQQQDVENTESQLPPKQAQVQKKEDTPPPQPLPEPTTAVNSEELKEIEEAIELFKGNVIDAFNVLSFLLPLKNNFLRIFYLGNYSIK
jgi:anti-sigma28 factor (negative regulator of flagellin synthesis)